MRTKLVESPFFSFVWDSHSKNKKAKDSRYRKKGPRRQRRATQKAFFLSHFLSVTNCAFSATILWPIEMDAHPRQMPTPFVCTAAFFLGPRVAPFPFFYPATGTALALLSFQDCFGAFSCTAPKKHRWISARRQPPLFAPRAKQKYSDSKKKSKKESIQSNWQGSSHLVCSCCPLLVNQPQQCVISCFPYFL